ncbi:MAG TPA: hypothetical protein VNW05_06715 [Steroidobacteraceae bacterium]|jgi:hypothetical protein|nr:hypothetical protein [Steroidobacteraceae bacterium]
MTPEIRAFEFALGLFAVLIGLAVADVATSFHRLMRNRTKVKWDPLALVAALYSLLLAVGMWFDLWGVRHFEEVRHFVFYLAIVAQLFVLFLIAAASLPDDVESSIDLREFYAGNRRYFWFLVSLNQLAYLVLGVYFTSPIFSRLSPLQMVQAAITLGASFIVSLVLLAAKSRGAHYVGLALLFLITLFHYWSMKIN